MLSPPVFDAVNITLVLALCLVLSFLSFRFGLLTASGSLSAFGIGMIIGILGSISWLLILILFTVLGFMVTRYKFQVKVRKGLQEGRRGERTYLNVLANSLVPAIIAVFSWLAGMSHEMIPAILYLSAISVAASDTMASELGILSDRTVLITNLKPVPPGTNGGVSAYGTVWALLGAMGASLLGWILLFPENILNPLVLVPIAAGFLGCNLDSVIGATLERGGYLGKLGNNILSMGMGSLFALGVLLALGGPL